MYKISFFFYSILSLFFTSYLFSKSKKDERIDVSKTIIEHVIDSHEWNFFGKKKGEKGFSIFLPVLLWNKGNGCEFFLSSQFYHGKVVQGKYGNYRMFQDKIYKTNSIGTLYIKNGYPKNNRPLDFSITKNVVSIIFSFLVLCFIFIRMVKSYKNYQPKCRLGLFLEYLILFIRNEIVIPNIGKRKYKIFFPFLLTIFFFILINNLMGLLPGFPNVTGNINTTFSLAIITFMIVIFNSNKSYWKHTFWMPNIPVIIKLILAPIELIGLFIRPLTLCIRLFANITAGHIIILSFICLIFLFKNFFMIGFSITFSLFISLLEIMVSFLQAFIFTALSSLLIGMTVKNYKHETY
ncbi:F0F1 ATP synthase subunit A [Blattabacterium cuenoti]|uniref:ATP synthase subunit a n=1 Tax=Blattabacterium sp. (Tryonicus sp.) TaxID=2712832 RepID=A0A6G6BY58_9FLAO|nr:F0F1 ATP synthase subunit A [Blattabacterium cuenoti]QID56938.1 ATP synthase subunit A [Blattabacterium sp. (Tryonicus sp.)]